MMDWAMLGRMLRHDPWWGAHYAWNQLARRVSTTMNPYRPNFWWRVNHLLAERWLGPISWSDDQHSGQHDE